MKVFPRTPHLWWSGYRSSDDLLLSEQESETFLQRASVVQEKLDGANVSIRLDERARLVPENRGKPVSSHKQFDPFKAWVAAHHQLHDLGSLILYGEWLSAQHGTPYDQLPDYFLAYDLYDTATERFLVSRDVREFCAILGVSCVSDLPVPRTPETLQQLANARSAYSTIASREGLYLRLEENGAVVGRAKLVRKGYRPRTNEEWTREGIVPNATIR